MSLNIKKLIPKSIKRPIKEMLLRRSLRVAIERMRKLPAGQVPDREQLLQLMTGWSNEGYAANLEYLEAVAQNAVRIEGPILECGSGATTILLGVLCEKRNIEVWSLEHFDDWRDRVSEVLKSSDIAGVHLCSAPLVEHGEFVWYSPPLERMPKQFSLVICDGPPGSTKGGRYGLLPVMGDRLPPGSTILLDDAGRADEAKLIKRWESEAGFQTELINTATSKYAVMRRTS
jgi:hypothetical protein